MALVVLPASCAGHSVTLAPVARAKEIKSDASQKEYQNKIRPQRFFGRFLPLVWINLHASFLAALALLAGAQAFKYFN